MTEVYKRSIRIQGKPDDAKGHFMQITDRVTGEHIPNVASALIHLNPGDVNKAELTYYEVNASGKLIVKDGDVVEHAVIAENPEIDLVALERGHTQIGCYDITYEGCATPGKPHVFLTIGDETRTAVQFYPDEALDLLKWLQQERSNLEQLAKTCNASRRSVKVEEVIE